MSARVGRQLRAEAYKSRSLRLTWGLAALGAAYATVNAVVVAALAGTEALSAPGGLSTEAAVRSVYGSGLSAYPFILVMGIMLVTGEFRHGTASTTFLVNPRRGSVVAAKFLTALAVGTGYAALATVVSVGLGGAVLAARGYGDVVQVSDATTIALGGFLAASLYGVMGVGIGALVRNQVAAIVGGLVAFAIVGDLLAGLLPRIGRWLPNGAANSLARIGEGGDDLLPQWAGGAVFVAWAVLLAVAGTVTTMRRDV